VVVAIPVFFAVRHNIEPGKPASFAGKPQHGAVDEVIKRVTIAHSGVDAGGKETLPVAGKANDEAVIHNK
jgi:hypothetical protein